MTFDNFTDQLTNWLNGVLHSDWLGNALIALVFIIATALCSHFVTILVRKILRSDKGPLPAASIFVNICRVVIWAIGISIVLSTCFDINVQAAVTALGIGGIAISLGFQTTLSNLIGGMEIVLSGIVEPGERIKVATYEGIVQDITWRNTTIKNDEGELVIVPNSVISSQALVKISNTKTILEKSHV